MKRTATTLVMLAGFGGGCASTDGPKPGAQGGFNTATKPAALPGVQGPAGEMVPMTTSRGAMPAGGKVMAADKGVVRAHVPGIYDGKVMQASGFGGGCASGDCGGGHGGGGGYGPGMPGYNAGVLPVPGMGPPGAVAAVGALVPGMQRAPTNQRTSILFTGPAGMKVTWQLPNGGFNDEASALTAPKDYNFLQAQVYRLRLTQILPNFPGRAFYPTLQVEPANPKTVTFLAHSSVPVTFTDEDFRQAAAGNLVVKVIYLPDPTFQDFATVEGPAEIVSTRLEPGADPVAEAQRRGSILAVIRLGNIDLENRASPAMTAPPGGVMMGVPVMMNGGSAPGTASVGGPAVVPPASKPLAPASP
ncbi:MAG: hypothetical protein K2X87_06325, partial [Gemmataceae bacterium]|nr:hypothetical protein [Gemmataceae bacterium]